MPGTAEANVAAPAAAGFLQRTAAWTFDAWLLALPAWWLARAWQPADATPWRAARAAISSAAEAPLRRLIDGASPLETALGLANDPRLTQAAFALQTALLQVFAPLAAAFVLLAFAWHVGFERSAWRGSPGKRVFGLRVVDTGGAPLSLMHSAWRFAAGAASWLTLNIGHAMAALPPRHRALHDLLSETRVVADPPRLSASARVWLLLQLALVLAAHAWLLLQLHAAVQAALDRVLLL